MGQSMVGRLAIKAKQVKPGDAFAAVVPAGGLVEIVDLEGKQVAEFVAFDHADPSEHLSLGVTRQQSKSIMLSLGMTLYSSRGRTMLDLVEDTVGRHDILWAAPTRVVVDAPAAPEASADLPAASGNPVSDPIPAEPASDEADAGTDAAPSTADEATTAEENVAVTTDPGTSDGGNDPHPSDAPVETAADPVTPTREKRDPLMGFAAALAPLGLGEVDAPDPVNFFMQLAVMQRGDLELRAPMSERGDRVVLKALTDLIVAVRCSAADDETNGERPSDILVRVYR